MFYSVVHFVTDHNIFSDFPKSLLWIYVIYEELLVFTSRKLQTWLFDVFQESAGFWRCELLICVQSWLSQGSDESERRRDQQDASGPVGPSSLRTDLLLTAVTNQLHIIHQAKFSRKSREEKRFLVSRGSFISSQGNVCFQNFKNALLIPKTLTKYLWSSF